MRKYQKIDICADDWVGLFVHPAHIGMGALESGYPSDDLTRAAMAGGGAWIYVRKGRILVREVEREVWVSEGESFLYANPTQAILEHPDTVDWIRVGFYGIESAIMLEQIIDKYGSYHKLPLGAEVVRKSQKLYNIVRRKSMRSAHYWSMAFYEWLMDLCRSLEYESEILEEGRKVVRNSRLLGLIHPNFKSYAEAMGYNSAYLARSIKKSWGGISPAKMLRLHRMHEAERLLKTTNLSIHEIAEKVCYSQPETFSTAFRKHYGISPLRYRHQLYLEWET